MNFAEVSATTVAEKVVAVWGPLPVGTMGHAVAFRICFLDWFTVQIYVLYNGGEREESQHELLWKEGVGAGLRLPVSAARKTHRFLNKE